MWPFIGEVLNSKFKHFVVVQLLQYALILMTPWTAALYFPIFHYLAELFSLMSIKLMSFKHFILCRPSPPGPQPFPE